MLDIDDLHVSYGMHEVLEGLNMHVKKGELYGLLGKNGAGKTTTIKIIAGIRKPDSGTVTIDGEKAVYGTGVLKNRWLLSKIGYMPDFFGVYNNLTVIEYMDFYRSIYCRDKKKTAEFNVAQLLEMVNLSDYSETYVDHLSRGMKQRLCLARTLISDPKLLVLDEPSSGMEPEGRKSLREILMELCAHGRTIILSSHVLSEIASTCTNIGMLENGRLKFEGSINEIMEKTRGSNQIKICFQSEADRGIELLRQDSRTSKLARKANEISFSFSGSRDEEAELLASLINNGIGVSFFGREAGNLEMLFEDASKLNV